MGHNNITERKTPARRMRGTGYPKAPVRRLLRVVESALKIASAHAPMDVARLSLERRGSHRAVNMPSLLLYELHEAWEALDGPREREDADTGVS